MNKYNDGIILKDSGLKKTRHREAILNIMRSFDRPMSTEEIFIALKDNSVDINMSTIYRALKSLAEKQVITKIIIANQASNLYEIKNKKHCHYMVCLSCKKIIPIEHCPLKVGYEKELTNDTGFTVEGHNLEIFGYCSQCKMKKR